MFDQPNTQDFAVSDPNGSSLLGAIALGFAAGYGGPSVQQMQAQMRQNSWQSWQQAQELKVRREEMAAANRRFEASLDLQRRELQQREAQSKRAEGGATARALMSEFGQTFRENRRIKASESAEGRAVERENAKAFAADLDRGMALGQMRPVGAAEFDLSRDAIAADRAAGVRQEERDFAVSQNREARAERRSEAAANRQVEIAKAVNDAKQGKLQMSASIRNLAAAEAKDSLTRDPGGSFEGHKAAWERTLGLAEVLATYDDNVNRLLGLYQSGDPVGEELRAAVDEVAASAQQEPRPTSRPTGGLPAIGTDSRPIGPTIPPLGSGISQTAAKAPISIPPDDDEALASEIDRILKSVRGGVGRDDAKKLAPLVKEAERRGMIPRGSSESRKSGPSEVTVVAEAARSVVSRAAESRRVASDAELETNRSKVERSRVDKTLTDAESQRLKTAKAAIKLRDAEKEIAWLTREYSRRGRGEGTPTEEQLAAFLADLVGANSKTSAFETMKRLRELRRNDERR